MTTCNMPKKRRSENKGFPEGWRWKNGKIRYRVPEGMEFKWDGKKEYTLGKTIPEAYRVWAERMDAPIGYSTMGDLMNRYEGEVISALPESQKYLNELYLKNLRPAFAHMGLNDIKPIDVYQYHDKRSQKKTDENGKVRGGPRIARVELNLLSDILSKAIKWGAIEKHPFKGEVEFQAGKARDRYIENWELNEFLSLQPKRKGDPTKVIQAYTNFKLISGLRQQDILMGQVSQAKEDGIHITPRKTRNSTGKKIILKWTPDLRAAYDLMLSVRPRLSPYWVCNRRGMSYYDTSKKDPASGWKSIWSRYMDRAIEETDLKERFTEHDLRAKTGSDLEDLAHAQKLLAHSSAKTTQKHYRRKPEIVLPAR